MAIHINERGHLNEEGVALYVDALRLDRTDRLPEHIRAHVAACQQCRVNVTGLYSLLADEPIESSHPTLGKSPGKWSMPPAAYRIAAAVAAVIGIAAVAYFYGRPTAAPEPPPSVATQQQTPEPAGTTEAKPRGHAEPAALASNFKPYENLEGLVGSELRGESFDVSSPGGHVTDPRAITFDWKSAGGGPWKIFVIDNRGGVVREAEVRSTPFVLNGPFKPGLYYWKVLQDDELAHVGKFRVE